MVLHLYALMPSHFSRVWLFVMLWTVALLIHLSMEFSRQEYWNGLHAFLQGIFPAQGLNLHFLQLLHCFWIAGGFFTTESLGSPSIFHPHGNPKIYISWTGCGHSSMKAMDPGFLCHAANPPPRVCWSRELSAVVEIFFIPVLQWWWPLTLRGPLGLEPWLVWLKNQTVNLIESLIKKKIIYLFIYFWLDCVFATFSSCSAKSSHCCGFSWCGHGLVALRLVESYQIRDWNCVPCIGRGILIHCTTREVLIESLILL